MAPSRGGGLCEWAVGPFWHYGTAQLHWQGSRSFPSGLPHASCAEQARPVSRRGGADMQERGGAHRYRRGTLNNSTIL